MPGAVLPVHHLARVRDMRRAVETARGQYRASERANALTLEAPLDFNRLPAATEQRVFDWFAAY